MKEISRKEGRELLIKADIAEAKMNSQFLEDIIRNGHEGWDNVYSNHIQEELNTLYPDEYKVNTEL